LFEGDGGGLRKVFAFFVCLLMKILIIEQTCLWSDFQRENREIFWIKEHRVLHPDCINRKCGSQEEMSFLQGLLRLSNVLEATHGTLNNVNNICTRAINSVKYLFVLFSGDLTGIR
jgi:hypothetical protein